MAVELRTAGPADADRVAGLHVASWRRHYRGAYADSFLDSDVVDDLIDSKVVPTIKSRAGVP